MRRKNWKNYSVDELEKLLPVSERWENQNLSNDFMFGKVMSDKKACAGVLNIILPEIETGEIIFTEIQKPLRDSIDSRGVRLMCTLNRITGRDMTLRFRQRTAEIYSGERERIMQY